MERIKVFYGVEGNYTDITNIVLTKLVDNGILSLPAGDGTRNNLFGDPIYGTVKHLLVSLSTDAPEPITLKLPYTCSTSFRIDEQLQSTFLKIVRRFNTIPIYIIVFNNFTYLMNTISQLSKIDTELIIIDNGSTYPPLLEYYKTCPYEILYTPSNLNPEVTLLQTFTTSFPEVFALTDPDLVFPDNISINDLHMLKELTDRYNVYKAGFALSLQETADLKFKQLTLKGNNMTIHQWEQMMGWQNRQAHPTLEVYKGLLATTFAVYNKRNYKGDPFEAVRVAGKYQCIHLPWYKKCIVPEEEQAFYNSTQKFCSTNNMWDTRK